jgi:hypothetical protein
MAEVQRLVTEWPGHAHAIKLIAIPTLYGSTLDCERRTNPATKKDTNSCYSVPGGRHGRLHTVFMPF